MKKQKGFSLIELLIVVAIILIIAAIAVPNLLRSRMAANESSAAGSERTVATSNVTYSTTYGIGFALGLSNLGPPAGGGTATSDEADLIDATLATTQAKSGYDFTTYDGDGSTGTTADPVDTYTLVATPTSSNVTGVSTFCIDQTNVVRKETSGTVVAAAGGAGIACDDGSNAFPPL